MAGSVDSSGDGDLGFQIAPMVDVVFVLMLFFMATAGMQITELELNLALPGSNAPSGLHTDLPVTPMVVVVDASGLVIVNDAIRGTADDKELRDLEELFKNSVIEFGNTDPVIIKPHIDAKHERVMDVLNAAGRAKVKNLTFN